MYRKSLAFLFLSTHDFFSPFFDLRQKMFYISFSSKPTTANMALLCFLSSGFFDNSKSFFQMYISRVPQLTCIWMSRASGLENLINEHLIRKIDINYKKGHLLLTSVLRLVVPINSGKLHSNWKERGLCYNDVFVSRPNRE